MILKLLHMIRIITNERMLNSKL